MKPTPDLTIPELAEMAGFRYEHTHDHPSDEQLTYRAKLAIESYREIQRLTKVKQ